MLILKQSTASQAVLLGPFVDSTDGVTAETALTIANTDIKLSKNGGTMASKNSGGGTHDANGWYTITLDATDTNTVGRMQISCAVSGALPVFMEVQVLEEAIFDALFAASAAAFDANQRVDVGSWLGTAVTTSATSAKPEVDVYSLSNSATAANNAETCFTGTITTLDALDTAQDTQHSTTQGLIGTPSDFGSGTSTIAANLEDIADNGTATYDRATDSLQAIRDRGDSAWTTGAGGSDRLLMVDTTIATLASQTSFTLTAGSADDSAYVGCTIVIEDASTSTQKAVGIVDAYTGATKTVTLLQDPGVFTMSASDKVYILAEKSLKATTAANYHVDVSSGGAVGIDWANVESPTTTVGLSGTTIGTCTTNTDMRGTDSAALASNYTSARAGYLDNLNIGENVAGTSEISGLNDPTAAAIADAIWDEATSGHVTAGTFGKAAADTLADTNELQTNQGNWATATGFSTHSAADVWASATRTLTANTNLNDPTAAAIASAVFTTAMTESYRSAGAAGTLAQYIHEIIAHLGEFAISGTTKTTKKLDGSTTAKTYTLDDGTSPTSITETT